MQSTFCDGVPSPGRRRLLNFLTGAVVVSAASSAAYPLAQLLMPPSEQSADGGMLARDIQGQPIPAQQLLAESAGTRALVAGLAGEPTYLTITDTGLAERGLVNNCTHLGCTFPWNGSDQQFQCPCHGSRYDPEGQVVRGPADRPLKLVRVEVRGDQIWIYPWQEADPRTGVTPWWA